MTNKRVPIFELIFDELDEFGNGVTAMSVVTAPAIKRAFVAFNSQGKNEPKIKKFKLASEEKRLIVGAALIPDVPVMRVNEQGEKFYVYMSAKTIEKIAHSFLKLGRQSNATVEHEIPVDGLHIVESWIVGDAKSDKSKSIGMDMPRGTWMVAMKIENDVVWNEFVKTGKLTGFSIEAMLGMKEVGKPVKTTKNDAERLAKAIYDGYQRVKNKK